MFKILEPPMQVLQELKTILSRKAVFTLWFLMKKYAKLKLLMLIPRLKLVLCFSITYNMVSTVKFFAFDTSIFSLVSDASISADELNKDLEKISEWVYKWKISFNPDFRK